MRKKSGGSKTRRSVERENVKPIPVITEKLQAYFDAMFECMQTPKARAAAMLHFMLLPKSWAVQPWRLHARKKKRR